MNQLQKHNESGFRTLGFEKPDYLNCLKLTKLEGTYYTVEDYLLEEIGCQADLDNFIKLNKCNETQIKQAYHRVNKQKIREIAKDLTLYKEESLFYTIKMLVSEINKKLEFTEIIIKSDYYNEVIREYYKGFTLTGQIKYLTEYKKKSFANLKTLPNLNETIKVATEIEKALLNTYLKKIQCETNSGEFIKSFGWTKPTFERSYIENIDKVNKEIERLEREKELVLSGKFAINSDFISILYSQEHQEHWGSKSFTSKALESVSQKLCQELNFSQLPLFTQIKHLLKYDRELKLALKNGYTKRDFYEELKEELNSGGTKFTYTGKRVTK